MPILLYDYPECVVCRVCVCVCVVCVCLWLCCIVLSGANVLVTDRGEIKLADFGSCKALVDESALTPSWASAGPAPSPREQGTPQWMAPEVVKGKVNNRGWQQADIWSLGCTVIEMATGAYCGRSCGCPYLCRLMLVSMLI